MALTAGARIGPYEVTAPLGEGGMGVVVRARDTKLQRDVALKLLPDHFADDPERLGRFQREAQVLASLNHANIAQIYGLEESGRMRCIVMELVEGETLQQRLKRGAIPVSEALRMARQMAAALEAAHERGIVHRDLKPANVKVLPDGTVKVLDFGLAKTHEPGAGAPHLSNSPTLVSVAATNAGVILGTAAYMSPEQARGENVDHRSDVFSFGCVLYEMLTGRQAFDGKTVSDVLASILAREPDAARLPASLPPKVRSLLWRCLAKEAKQRWQAAGDVRYELEATEAEPPERIVPDDAAGLRRQRLGWIMAAVFLIAFASVAILHVREAPPVASPEMRVEISTPSTGAPLEFALSPDGRYIVFVASGDGPQRLWLRALDKTDAQPMAGTEGADYPFWSADSRSIAFTASGKLQRIDIAGGPPQTLTNTIGVRGGTWNADGTILFNAAATGPLSRIAASGGDPATVTRLVPGQNAHNFPQFLPDGRHFLYWAQGTSETSGIYLGSLDGGEPKRLAAADSVGAYLTPGMGGANPLGRSDQGMIAFVRGTTLIAQYLDLNRGELTGDPVRLADPVGTNGLGYGSFSISAAGPLAYRAGGALRQLRWYDRTGKAVGVAGEPDSAALLYPELSHDGARVALQRAVRGNFDVWLMDLVRGGLTRFTFDPANDGRPLWSPDDAKIAFDSGRKGHFDLYLKPSSSAGAEELALETPNDKFGQDWSKDGRFLLYSETGPKTARDLWALPITRNDRKPILIVNTPFEELNGQFSPDGRWVAYETNESGRFEIVVQPFPVPAGKWQVSTGGGIQPRWRADGKELYFIAANGKLMAASITAGATSPAGTPVALFSVTVATGAGANKHEYTVSRDGRFLINQPAEYSTTSPITLILNWHPERGK